MPRALVLEYTAPRQKLESKKVEGGGMFCGLDSDIYSRGYRLAVISIYFGMIGWFGLDDKPLMMLWSVPQVFFSRANDFLGFFGHVCDHV